MKRLGVLFSVIAVLALVIVPGAVFANGNHGDNGNQKGNQGNDGNEGNGNEGAKPQYDHIFVIVEENTAMDEIIGDPNAPTFNQIAQDYGFASNSFGVTHPSEPNYVTMIGGDYFGIQDDAPYAVHQINGPSLVDQLEGAGLTWKAYSQSMPTPGFEGNCFPDNTNCLYASKHNPFMNFTNISTSAAEKANLVPDTQLFADLATGNVPNYSYIVSDQCHDGHGQSACPGSAAGDPPKETLIKWADEYLSTVVTAIQNSPMWDQGHNAIVVTFDEDDFNAANQGCCGANPGGGPIYTAVIQNHQQKPIQDDRPYNHYSMLATVEKAFGLDCLNNACNVQTMDKLFGLHSTPNN